MEEIELEQELLQEQITELNERIAELTNDRDNLQEELTTLAGVR